MRVDWCVSSWFRIKNTHSLTHSRNSRAHEPRTDGIRSWVEVIRYQKASRIWHLVLSRSRLGRIPLHRPHLAGALEEVASFPFATLTTVPPR